VDVLELLRDGHGRVLDDALAYAARGWFVFPLAPRSKVPITPNGFHDATRSEERIREWWTSYPDANIGIDCARSGLAVVDVDQKSGGPGNYDGTRRRLGLGLTLRALTGGGGWHDYYEGAIPTRLLAQGIDLRGEGSYVVAPPSVHESGKAYAWTNERVVARAPDGLREAVEERRNGPAPEVPEQILEGGRHAALFSFAGTMRRRGATEEEILAALAVMNKRCVPQLERHELEHLAHGAMRYPAEPSAIPEPAYVEPASPEKDDKPAPARKLVWLHLADALDMVDAEPDWLWEGYAARGWISILTGLPKCGKTTLLCSLLHKFKQGEPFLGQKVAPTGVFILTEQSAEVFKETLSNFALEFDSSNVGCAFYRSQIDQQTWDAQVDDATAICLEEGWGLLVIDTWARWASLESDHDAVEILRKMRPLYRAAEAGLAVLIVHHAPKSAAGDSAAQAVSGRNELAGAVDIILNLKTDGDARVLTGIGRSMRTPARRGFSLTHRKRED
jgi:hypothetical protein